MTKRMLIDAVHTEEMRVVIADDNQVYEFDFVTSAKKQIKGNIYLAKVTRVEPSLQAAFVEYGGGKQGFLPFSEIHPDYYQIPMSDRKRLLEEAARSGHDDDLSATDTGEEASSGNDQEGGFTDAPFTSDGEEHDEFESGEDVQPMAFDINELTGFTPPEDEPSPSSAYEQATPLEAASQPVEEHEAPAFPQAQEAANAEFVDGSSPFPEGHSADITPVEGETTAQPGEKAEEQTAEDVEALGGEEAEEARERRARKTGFTKRYKIQEVIKRGQIVLVQVIKEERGNKGVSLTTYLSLPGRYCVLMPNSPKDGGISRKIASADDRKRLKAISTELKLAKGMSVIIRTAGIDRTRAEIKRDYDYLVKLWNHIRQDTLSSTAPALIYEESDLVKRSIRDLYSNDLDEVLVEGEAAFKTAKDFMKMILPSHSPKVKQHTEGAPLFYEHGIEEQLLQMHDPVVKLKSGGYIVINPTEALISIDVNSGRATGERNIEETAAKTNLEAAVEIARQLRLRDLAGLIVIDFIDMMESRNRRAVEKTLKDALKLDRAKIQLGRISPFGLLEMSRQRLRPSISESSTVQCPHCTGRGVIRSNESMSIQLIRNLEKEASTGQWQTIRLNVSETVALHILNSKRDQLASIENRFGIRLQIAIDPTLPPTGFSLEKMRNANQNGRRDEQRDRNRDRRDRDRERSRERERRLDQETMQSAQVETVAEETFPTDGADDETSGQPQNGRNKNRRGRRGGRRRNGNRNNFNDQDSFQAEAGAQGEDESFNTEEDSAAGDEQNASAPGDDQPQEESGNRRRRGQRGGRGRRKWRDDRDGNRTQTQETAPSNDGAGDAPEAGFAGSWAPEGWEQQQNVPAFAAQPLPERKEANASEKPAEAAQQTAPAAESQSNGEPRKGWWQRIIELE